MYELNNLLVTGLVALIIGAGLGAIFTRRLSIDGRKQRDLEKSLDELLRQQKDYQHQVVEHFTDTANLLNKLAESYREVHNHIASGASTLCEDDAGTILKRIPETAMAPGGDEPEPASIKPPLDYAPKPSPYATGVLNEEFGLDKRRVPLESTRAVIEEQVAEEDAPAEAVDPEPVQSAKEAEQPEAVVK